MPGKERQGGGDILSNLKEMGEKKDQSIIDCGGGGCLFHLRGNVTEGKKRRAIRSLRGNGSRVTNRRNRGILPRGGRKEGREECFSI